MDSSSFDRLVRVIGAGASRRGVLHSAFATVVGLGALSLPGAEVAEAKKKKVTICHSGQTLKVSKKSKKKHLKHGDTLGACPVNPPTPPGGKTPGTLCVESGECTPPFICALPLNDSGGDKRCCGAAGAPCGGDNQDLDDLPPICCQGFICSTDGQGTSTPGTCQPAPQD